MWFMQAHLKDLAKGARESKTFVVCERVLQLCHSFIYNTIYPNDVQVSHLTNTLNRSTAEKLPAHLHAGLVGIGMMLAGVPGMPKITEIMGDVAIKQGRHGNGDRRNSRLRSQLIEDDSSNSPGAGTENEEVILEETKSPVEDDETDDDDDLSMALGDNADKGKLRTHTTHLEVREDAPSRQKSPLSPRFSRT